MNRHHEISIPERPAQPEEDILTVTKKDLDSSDSDTEVASGDESVGSLEDDELDDDAGDEAEEEEEEDDDDDDEEDEEDEDEGGGSTTEIETDSEFAEDPPHSVPGTIPTIVVDEPEQIVTRMIESTPISHTQTPNLKRDRRDHRHHQNHNNHHNHQPPSIPPIYHIEDLNNRMVEPVKKTSVPERPLPRVTAVPKKWEPLSINPEGFGSKISLELKKKYLQGNVPGMIGSGAGAKNKSPGQPQEATAKNQFRSVLDMISEQQKLLQPAPKPSATMQAFLEGAEKLKNKSSISPLSVSPRAVDGTDKGSDGHQILGNMIPALPVTTQVAGTGTTNKWNNEINHATNNGSHTSNGVDNTLNMNRLNLEKTIEACQAAAEAAAAAAEVTTSKKHDLNKSPGLEKQDIGKEKDDAEHELTTDDTEQIRQMMLANTLLMVNGGSSSTASESPPVLSDGMSQSETETQSTIIVTNKGIIDPAKTPVAEKPFECLEPTKPTRTRTAVEVSEEDEDSDTEAGSGDGEPLSDLDDLDIEEISPVKIEPPRVEIEDEFGGVTLAVDVDAEIDESIRISSSDSRDSLNSGVFLETELSEWARDAGNECGEIVGEAVKDNNNKSGKRIRSGKSHGKSSGGAARKEQQAAESRGRLALELEDMDFMDVDGLSSPDDPKLHHPVGLRRKQVGYAKLQAEGEEEEENSDSIPPGFSVVLRAQPHDDQPSPNTLERQQRPTYSSDDQDESGHSSTPTVESMSAGIPAPSSTDILKKSAPAPLGLVTEAVNPVLVKKPNNPAEVAMLDKVGPFSNARDSLDYRKMKGVTSPIKSKDLYSTYCLPSVKGDVLEEVSCPSSEPEHDYHQLQHQSSLSSPSSSSSSKVNPSPEMARKIEEINKERAKQNDLIRSMVMGRIRKSPEKNSRRGSRGSLSPLGGASSSGSSGSASGSNEHVLRCDDNDQLADSRRSSQNSILSHSHDGEENSSANEVEIPSRDNSNSSAAEPILQMDVQIRSIPPGDLGGKSGSSSQISTSGESSIPHQKLVKSSSTTTPSQSSPPAMTQQPPFSHPEPHGQHQAAYEPVFTSSPRFRHRPKFDTPLSVYQSVTNPPTPVNPSMTATYSPSILTPNSDGTSSSGGGQSHQNNVGSTNISNKSIKSFKSHSPSFYRSMPDLSAFLVSPAPSMTPSQDNGAMTADANGGFATPDMKQWEAFNKHIRGGTSAASSVDREKARQAARERARLKSDEELGLSPTDYANLKEKVRRKVSVPDSDDVFTTNGRPGGSVPTTPVRESLRGGSFHHPSRRLARPMSDVFDAAFSLRPNVDFPITKTNPFLVSSTNPCGNDMVGNIPCSLMMDNSSEWYQPPPIPMLPPSHQDLSSSSHSAHHGDLEEQSFAHIKLRMSSSPGTPGRSKSERKVSPEKAKSMGWAGNDHGILDGMPNYFTSSVSATSTPPATSSTSRTPLSLTPRADGNWFFDKPSPAQSESTLAYATRPRSNTLSDLNLSPGSFQSGNSNNSTAPSPPGIAQSTSAHQNINNNNDHHRHHPEHHHHLPQASTASSPMPSSASTTVAKAKALSTDTLLDAADDSDSPAPCPPDRTKGVSVPDISHSVQNDEQSRNHNHHPRVSPERKTRKSKDRDRRRSLIQAVSDFFTIRGSSSSGSAAGSQNGSPTDKSSSQNTTSGATNNTSSSYDGGPGGDSSSTGGGSKEKFSLFKLTPKILQSAKDRRNSKSRENILSPPPPAPSSPPAPAPTQAPPAPLIDPNNPPPKPARAAFNTYLSQPEMVIQRLTASPSTFKSNRTSQGRGGYGGVDQPGLGATVDHMATLSIVATPARPNRGVGRSEHHHRNSDSRRYVTKYDLPKLHFLNIYISIEQKSNQSPNIWFNQPN